MNGRAAVPAGAATLALLGTACLLAWRPGSAVAARSGGAVAGTAPLFFALLVAAFAAYVLGLLLIRRAPPSTRAAVVVAAAIQLVPLGAPLLLSTDAWTYWSYGWIAARGGGNPYTDEPSSFPADPALSHMGSAWRDTTSVYGPAFTLASEPVALVAGDSPDAAAWIFKSLAAAGALGAALLAGYVAHRRAFAVALVGWNPLLAAHLAGGGHNDAWIGALILAALALSSARRVRGAGVVWVLAATVKWVPALFLGLKALESRATRRPAGLWWAAGAAALATAGAAARYGLSWPLAILPLAGNAALETRYAIPHRLQGLGLPHGVALGLAVIVLAVGAALLVREALRGRARLALAACLLLVTTPYLAVWYLAWAVPLAAAEEDATATAGCLLLCAYLLPQTIPL